MLDVTVQLLCSGLRKALQPEHEMDDICPDTVLWVMTEEGTDAVTFNGVLMAAVNESLAKVVCREHKGDLKPARVLGSELKCDKVRVILRIVKDMKFQTRIFRRAS